MNNLSLYCGLVEAKIKASDKDLPVSSPTCICISSSYQCISCSEDESIIEEFCGKQLRKSKMDQYDSVFEELEKGKSILYLLLVLLFCFFKVTKKICSFTC